MPLTSQAAACHGSSLDADSRSLAAVLQAIDASGVSWLMLPLAEGHQRDRDEAEVLVDPQALNVVTRTLTLAGLVAVPGSQPGQRSFLGYDAGSHRWVIVTVSTAVEFTPGRPQPAATPALLASRVRAGAYWRLGKDDAFWHAFLSWAGGRNDLVPESLGPLAAEASAAGPLAAIVDRLDVAGASAAEVLTMARRGEWSVRRDRLPMQHALVGSRRNGPRGAVLLLRKAWYPLRDFRRFAGITIAIIGPDGAGKTTLAEGLRATLPLPSRYVYMGVWKAYPRDRWLRYVPGLRLALRMLRLTFRSMEAAFHRRLGRVVLLDRFTYDVLLPAHDLDRRGRITAALVRRVSAEPQMVIVLDAPAELMFARKGEQGVELLAERRASYLELARNRDDSVVIDAREPVQMVRAAAEEAIWKRISRQWAHGL